MDDRRRNGRRSGGVPFPAALSLRAVDLPDVFGVEGVDGVPPFQADRASQRDVANDDGEDSVSFTVKVLSPEQMPFSWEFPQTVYNRVA